MLQPTSRYTTISEVREFKTRIVSVRTKSSVPSFLIHTVRDGESFDLLAARYLGSATLYWKIADLNPHVPFPDRITAGTKVRIPQ